MYELDVLNPIGKITKKPKLIWEETKEEEEEYLLDVVILPKFCFILKIMVVNKKILLLNYFCIFISLNV